MARDTVVVPLQNNILESVNAFVPVQNAKTGRPTQSRGVFSSYPFMTPKYARHRPSRRGEYDQTMARMFIRVPPKLYDKFYASLEDADTRKIARALAGDDVSKGGHGYIDFLLQRAMHELTEKAQISETLSDSYVAFFFGQAPPTFQYSGVLLNTYQDDWTMRMFRIFRDLGRGTQLARQGLILSLRYDSMIVQGAMTNINWSLQAGQEGYCPFSFSLLVKSIQVIYGNVAPPTQFEKDEGFTPEGVQLIGSGTDENNASQTVVDAPQESPAGVTEPEFTYYEPTSDVTGTTYVAPEVWETELGLQQ